MKIPTKAQASLAVDLIKAIAENKKIQIDLGKGKFELLPITTETSTFEGILKLIVEGKKLRVKPLPKLVPWNYTAWKEKFIDPNFYVVSKGNLDRMCRIGSITKSYVYLNDSISYPFTHMATYYTGPNGEPLGTYEE